MIVNKTNCKSCPFKQDERGAPQDVELMNQVIIRCLHTQKQQLCHGTDNKTYCRGMRDHWLQILFRTGVIESPTDKAFEAASSGAKRKVAKFGK